MKEKNKVVKFFSSEIKSIDLEKFTVDAIVSTKKVDRDGDIILPEAFTKRLKLFKEHPVLLSSHFYYDLKSQIGEAQAIKVTDTGVEVKFKYYVGEGNEQADWAFNLAQKGIAAWSIGFMGWEYDWIKEKDGDSERITGRKYTDIELLEISQVLIPSNRGALQSGRSAVGVQQELFEMAEKAFTSGELKEWVEKEKPKECACEFNSDIKQAVKTGDICGACNLPLTKAQKESLAKSLAKEADDQEARELIEGATHYSESLFEDRTKSPLDSLELLVQTVRDSFQN